MSAKSGSTTTKLPINSTVSLSSDKNSLTTCIPGDIQVNYSISKKDYDESKTMIDNIIPGLNNTSELISKFIKDIPAGTGTKKTPAMKSLEVCVPRKCSDGSQPVNIGKLMGPTNFGLLMGTGTNIEPIDMYMCASPGTYINNKDGKCINGGAYVDILGATGMCIDMPKYYFKNFQ